MSKSDIGIPSCLIGLVLFLFIGVSSCKGKNSEDYPTVSLCPNGSYDVEQAQYLNQTMFSLLGLLREHLGRFDLYTGEPVPNRVDIFYSSETELADKFEKLMIQFKNESEFSFAHTRETDDNGNIYFYSVELSKLINSYYSPGKNLYTLDRNIFCNASQEDMLSYIERVYLRHGNRCRNSSKENHTTMGRDEAVTTGLVLHRLGCRDASVYTSTGPVAPIPFWTIFEPNELVKDRLGVENVLSVPDLVKKHPNCFRYVEIYQIIN